jgi:Nickel responsive protein SCO4226-like
MVGIYLVERYLPDTGAGELRSLVERLEDASARLCADGTPIRYLDTTFMPEEESCFCRFEAPSLHAIALLNRLANAPFARICAAVVFAPGRAPELVPEP